MTGDPERAMILYAQLASIAARKQQFYGRDRFLVLTGVTAARAGWPEVAARCRQLITAHAPHHITGRYASFADALRDENFAPFVRQVERFCPPERAEHLLASMGLPLRSGENIAAGPIVMQLLADPSE